MNGLRVGCLAMAISLLTLCHCAALSRRSGAQDNARQDQRSSCWPDQQWDFCAVEMHLNAIDNLTI
jgi:hypothetical protein